MHFFTTALSPHYHIPFFTGIPVFWVCSVAPTEMSLLQIKVPASIAVSKNYSHKKSIFVLYPTKLLPKIFFVQKLFFSLHRKNSMSCINYLLSYFHATIWIVIYFVSILLTVLKPVILQTLWNTVFCPSTAKGKKN